MKAKNNILFLIVIAQFCCTSLWFAGNGVMANLILDFGLEQNALSHLTAAVQFGFIMGTLTFALFTIADRYSPSTVFFFCALAGGMVNLGILLENNNLSTLIFFRWACGFFLAGIYPVGMKIAADYFQEGLGKSLGFLVGALVLGTAFPHLLKGFTNEWPWQVVIIITSILAGLGGSIILLFVPDGPYRKPSQQTDFSAWFRMFQQPAFRSAAVGYFGHMWELYAFWAFVPLMLTTYMNLHPSVTFNVSMLSFLIIGTGSLACVLGGYLSLGLGAKKVAFSALFLSFTCCLISPFVFYSPSSEWFLAFLIFWGLVVIADSPLFSTLVAQNAPSAIKGTALTIVNCIGFSITIISIQLINGLSHYITSQYLFIFLSIGPAIGLIAMKKRKTEIQ